MSGPGRNKDGNRGGMVMETIRDYEAMVYILEHNRKSAGKGESISWKKISYEKLSEEMKSYPARMKRMLGKLVLNGKIEIKTERPFVYRVLIKSVLTAEEFKEYQHTRLLGKFHRSLSKVTDTVETVPQTARTVQAVWQPSEAMQKRQTGAGNTFVYSKGNSLSVHESFERSKQDREYYPAGEKAGKRKAVTIW
jgi:hypothetical protein